MSQPCGCGCGAQVGRRYGHQRAFVDREHYTRAMASASYAAFRRRRALAGVEARRRRRRIVARPCGCGCGALVGRRDGRQRRFVDRMHYARALAGPRYAVLRHRRARAASAVARVNRRRAAIARAARFRSKPEAYSVGYRTGYNAAARWWRAKLEQWRQERAA
jgi:hypothetical protein